MVFQPVAWGSLFDVLATVMAEPKEVVLFALVCQQIILWSVWWAMVTEPEEVEGHFASRRKTAVILHRCS